MRVWVSAGSRPATLIPENLIITHSGIDYAKVWTARDGAIEVPVQRGAEQVLSGGMPELEILSGPSAGDRLLKP